MPSRASLQANWALWYKIWCLEYSFSTDMEQNEGRLNLSRIAWALYARLRVAIIYITSGETAHASISGVNGQRERVITVEYLVMSFPTLLHFAMMRTILV